MKPFEHLLILSDLDNTFLGKASRIVPENVEAIERFKSLGGKFAFATGRDPFALLRVVPTAAEIANYPCIVTNGAYVYDFQAKNTIRYHQRLGSVRRGERCVYRFHHLGSLRRPASGAR